MAKEILCGFGVDVDAVAGWLGSYGGEDSPDDISRGLFAGEVGAPRLLELFRRWGIRTSWFIPGHSIETFPAEMKEGFLAHAKNMPANWRRLGKYFRCAFLFFVTDANRVETVAWNDALKG